MAQNVFAATVPPLNAMLVVPPIAVTVPPQPLFRFGVDEIVKPVGSVSVNASPVSATPFVFVILNVSDVLPFSGIVGAPNVFMMLGGDTTVRFALAVLPVPPSVDETALVVLV